MRGEADIAVDCVAVCAVNSELVSSVPQTLYHGPPISP